MFLILLEEQRSKMKKLKNIKNLVRIILFLLHFLLDLNEAKSEFTRRQGIQAENVEQLLNRILGSEIAKQFKIVIIGSDKDANSVPVKGDIAADKVELESYQNNFHNSTSVIIRATSGVSASVAINHYLKYYCNSQITWDSKNINVKLPLPEAKFTLRSYDQFRYYSNVCTFGYTFAFWKWKSWERHIDWMALNGINLPLAFTGQEVIWNRVYRKLGLSQKVLDLHFAGPAFLPWGRMGNLNGWGGPLPPSWHNFTLKLQHKILKRMRGLGMLPVLPGFAGHIPKSSLFIKEYSEEFGSNHVYNCDPFNEMNPRTNNLTYIRQIGSAIYKAMYSADSRAIWLMQGWLFRSDAFWKKPQIEALLTSVPLGKMIILDLDSTDIEVYTKTNFYFGQNFIFNDLNNFGGQVGMFGRLGVINERLFPLRKKAKQNLSGVGLTPEGLSDSYISQDFLLESSWRENPVSNLSDWCRNYSVRRYGVQNKAVEEAWQILGLSVFDYKGSGNFAQGYDIITQGPNVNRSRAPFYRTSDLIQAWDLLISAKHELGHNDNYRHDLVDVTRQVLNDAAWIIYDHINKAYLRQDIDSLRQSGQVMLTLLHDMDGLLSCDQHFMLGPWLQSAKSVGTRLEERRLYEFNARNQVTLWGPGGQILDYAAKQWSGLISDYYVPKWLMFLVSLQKCIVEGREFDPPDFRRQFIQKVGTPFTQSRKLYPLKPDTKNTLNYSTNLYNKWRHLFKRRYSNQPDIFSL